MVRENFICGRGGGWFEPRLRIPNKKTRPLSPPPPPTDSTSTTNRRIHNRRIPSSKGEQAPTPGSTNRHPHSALTKPPPPPQRAPVTEAITRIPKTPQKPAPPSRWSTPQPLPLPIACNPLPVATLAPTPSLTHPIMHANTLTQPHWLSTKNTFAGREWCIGKRSSLIECIF